MSSVRLLRLLAAPLCAGLAALTGCGEAPQGALDPSAAPTGDGQYTLVASHSGLVLDVENGRTDAGAPITQAPGHGGQSQQWAVTHQEGDSVKIANVQSGHVLDIANGSLDWGARVLQWPDHGGANQRWSLKPFEDGTFSLVSENSGLCLDVQGASPAAGAGVLQYKCHGAGNQRWKLVASAATSAAVAVPALDLGAPGSYRYKITDYGDRLAHNKKLLGDGADAAGATLQEKVLLIAMAMQETNHCDPEERDRSKDNTPSANISAYNMNIDMIQMLGYTRGDSGRALNDPANSREAAEWVLKGFHTWGIERTLNFHRGGRTAFQDGHSYGAYDYRNAISSAYKAIAADPSLLTDSRRVEVDLYAVY